MSKSTASTPQPEKAADEFELSIKQVKLFKFTSGNGHQVNIYVEPITDRTGRLIIATPKKLFQRYFDGVSGGIYNFLASNDSTTISYVFDASEGHEQYIAKRLAPIWDLFQESIEPYVSHKTAAR